MGVVTAVSRLFGFVRVGVIAVVFGTTLLGDAFEASNRLSNVLFELLAAGALSAVLVPTFVDLLDKDDQAGAEKIAGQVLTVALVVLGAVSLIGMLASPLLATVLINRPSENQRALVTFLLPFIIPQILLYAWGTIASAGLFAKRRFAITAAAPIGNTVVMAIGLGIFYKVAGDNPGVQLSLGERMLLVSAATGGVLAFVGILVVACERTGFRLRPVRLAGDRRILEVLRHSGWGVALHSAAGLLLGAATVASSGVTGAVVAYSIGFVVFLAPYGVIAQPIHTAILPEMATEARQHGEQRVAVSLRWSLERMALFLLPVTAAMAALAQPAMNLLRYGEIKPNLLAAAVAGLALGLFAYSAFLLLARGYYALDESRWPGLVAIASAVVGMAVMVGARFLLDGDARVWTLGLAHSIAYTVGAVVLGVSLWRRTGVSLIPAASGRVFGLAAVVGVGAWLASRALLGSDPTRLADLMVLLVLGVVGGAVVLGGYRFLGVHAALTRRESVVPERATEAPS